MERDDEYQKQLGVFARRRGLGEPAAPPAPSLTEQIYLSGFQRYIQPFARPLGFRDAKALSHRIFNDALIERPFFKETQHQDLWGYVTTEHEIFVRAPFYEEAVIHEAAHLLLELPKGKADPYDGHTAAWFGNWLWLMLEYSSVDAVSIAMYSNDVRAKSGFEFDADLTIGENFSSWKNLKPGDEHYKVAVMAGCEQYNGKEPEPLRDPL